MTCSKIKAKKKSTRRGCKARMSMEYWAESLREAYAEEKERRREIIN
jgi:hypothetical protein